MWYLFPGIGPSGEDFENAGCLSRGLAGVFLPIVFASLAALSFTADSITIPIRVVGSQPTFRGFDSALLAGALLSIGLALHFRFLWAQSRGLWRVADPLIVLALLGPSACSTWLIVRHIAL